MRSCGCAVLAGFGPGFRRGSSEWVVQWTKQSVVSRRVGPRSSRQECGMSESQNVAQHRTLVIARGVATSFAPSRALFREVKTGECMSAASFGVRRPGGGGPEAPGRPVSLLAVARSSREERRRIVARGERFSPFFLTVKRARLCNFPLVCISNCQANVERLGTSYACSTDTRGFRD